MSLEIQWHPAAERRLLSLPRADAEKIDRAVQELATKGTGDLRRVNTETGLEYRLHASPHFVRVTIDRTSRTLHVWSIRRL